MLLMLPVPGWVLAEAASDVAETHSGPGDPPIPTLVAIDLAGQAVVLRDNAGRLSVLRLGASTTDGHWRLKALTPDQARLQRLQPGASGAEQLRLTLTRNSASATRIHANPPYRPPAPSLHLQPARVAGKGRSTGSVLAIPGVDHPAPPDTDTAGEPAANGKSPPTVADGNVATVQPGEPL